MLRRFSAGLIAATAFAFLAPLAASATGYQPSMVDSTAIEGQFLIAGAGNKAACEAKGKSWKPRNSYFGADTAKRYAKQYCNGKGDYADSGGTADVKKCSCQQ